MTEDNQRFPEGDEKIYWTGEPVVSILNVKAIIFYILPGIFLLLLWCGCIEYGGDHTILKTAYSFIHQEDVLVRILFLLLIISLIIFPVVRWFLYYKRVVYIFTDKRAFACYKGSNEIDYQIEASDIPHMHRSYHGKERVSLYKYIQEEADEDRGITRIVRVGFEGIPVHVLDFYEV